jgi:hypothetical protein
MTVFAIGFELDNLRRVIRFYTVHALLQIVRHLLVGKIFSAHDRKPVQVADLGTVDVFNLAVRHLANVAMAPNAGYRSVDRLMKKIGINIIVVQCALVIVYPEPPVFVAEKAILRITGKKFRTVRE